ncbi:MAG: ribosome recycling factor [bacterium]|nr:ribosome recycling factor [bacterium]
MRELLQETESKMGKAFEALQKELATVRTGRANPSVLDRISVDSYGSALPLNQVSTISVPDANSIIVQPWDKSIIDSIEKAILAANLGLTPNNDGTVIRISVPKLTEERRMELVKLIKKMVEESKVSVRRVRGDANKQVEKAKSDSEVSEDVAYRTTEKIQELTNSHCDKMDGLGTDKEAEILEI